MQGTDARNVIPKSQLAEQQASLAHVLVIAWLSSGPLLWAAEAYL